MHQLSRRNCSNWTVGRPAASALAELLRAIEQLQAAREVGDRRGVLDAHQALSRARAQLEPQPARRVHLQGDGPPAAEAAPGRRARLDDEALEEAIVAAVVKIGAASGIATKAQVALRVDASAQRVDHAIRRLLKRKVLRRVLHRKSAGSIVGHTRWLELALVGRGR